MYKGIWSEVIYNVKTKYNPILYQTMLDFEAPPMNFVDSFDKYILLFLLVVQFKADRCVTSIKNINCNMLCLRPG